MKPAPTLIDTLYRLSFKPEVAGWRSPVAMRNALFSAHRFVADEPMSAFMAELANEPFVKTAEKFPRAASEGSPLNLRIADSLRVSARLPHEAVWIEYDLHAYQTRSQVVRGAPPLDLTQVPRREGWLIQQHPRIDSAHIVHLFTQADREHEDGFAMWTYPFAMAWCSDDSPLPWHTVFARLTPSLVNPEERFEASGLLVGFRGYVRDNVAYVHSPLIVDPHPQLQDAYSALLAEWMGVIRRIWALLATINHLPLRISEVRQSKGFLARGQIKKYLNHRTITLNIPAKRDTRVLVRKVIAIAHRARHYVRAHWRDDHHHPPLPTCNPHLWELLYENDADHIYCTTCKGRQTYIHKHERGDARLGWVLHDYRLKHEEA